MKPLRTESDYQEALKRVTAIWEAQENSPEFDELEILVTLIEKYEKVLITPYLKTQILMKL